MNHLKSIFRQIQCGQFFTGEPANFGGVVVGLEAPVDEPSPDEAAYIFTAGDWTLRMDTPHHRARTLAFARLLGHLLGDGSISAAGQGRMNAGQAVDRETILNDVELLTSKRPTATRYDDRKWAIVLPAKLTSVPSNPVTGVLNTTVNESAGPAEGSA